jgi:hypothetical protein
MRFVRRFLPPGGFGELDLFERIVVHADASPKAACAVGLSGFAVDVSFSGSPSMWLFLLKKKPREQGGGSG